MLCHSSEWNCLVLPVILAAVTGATIAALILALARAAGKGEG